MSRLKNLFFLNVSGENGKEFKHNLCCSFFPAFFPFEKKGGKTESNDRKKMCSYHSKFLSNFLELLIHQWGGTVSTQDYVVPFLTIEFAEIFRHLVLFFLYVLTQILFFFIHFPFSFSPFNQLMEFRRQCRTFLFVFGFCDTFTCQCLRLWS